jgi:hypothetical protein
MTEVKSRVDFIYFIQNFCSPGRLRAKSALFMYHRILRSRIEMLYTTFREISIPFKFQNRISMRSKQILASYRDS